jgi:protease I
LEGYVVPHLTIAEVKVENFDAFILIGGYGAYLYLWDDEDLQKIIQQANEQHKLIAAASTATVALANAGILNGKKATVYPDYNAAVILQEKGAIHVYEDIITDDNIITSNHPQHAVQLGEAIISKLSGKNEE